jgi:mycothiol synthase
MIVVRPVETDRDLVRWAQIKSQVHPNDPVTAEQLKANDEEERLLVLAELDGHVVGCGFASLSHFAGRVAFAARVLPDFRRQGVGTAIAEVLMEHARSLGRNGLIGLAEPESAPFAERLGMTAVDEQLQQRRIVGGDEPAPAIPDGLEIVSLDGRREELLRALWPVALASYGELPFDGGSDLVVTIEQWLRDEATRPDGSFAVFEEGEPVAYAGLVEHADGAAAAEHGLTVVRADRRRRGIARTLKRMQLHWASQNGVLELITWTQRRNAPLQELNRSLGYADSARVITFHGELA